VSETILSYSGLLFLPLITLVAFGATTLSLRLLRLTRYPGFRRRFDPELRFLTRGPKLIGLGVVLVGVLVPTVLGVLLPAKPTRHVALVDSHESGLSWDSVVQTDADAAQTEAHQGLPEAPLPSAGEGAQAGAPAASIPRSAGAPSSDRAGEPREPTPAEISESIRHLVPLSLEEYGYRNTVQVAPEAFEEGAFPEAVSSVEVLFVHAHPDDESLDFAVLMSGLARKGLSVGALLLTDGESGLDRYPYRSPVPGYQEETLAGKALQETRIREAAQALRVLGADYYFRMGLPNHPYNGTADERALGEVLEAWGGEELLVARLSALIRATEPRLIVAPDLGSDAREHFEHEATGYLVRRAVEKLAAEGEGPGGYLVSVDPFQRSLYPATVGVPKKETAVDLAEVQKAALSQHHTQADASVIGIRRLVGIPEEYYLPVFWDLEESLGSMLGMDEELVARESPLLEVALAYQEDVGHRPAPAME
jgi:LmbE family N-acetylglucosaminyl deacetylase